MSRELTTTQSPVKAVMEDERTIHMDEVEKEEIIDKPDTAETSPLSTK